MATSAKEFLALASEFRLGALPTECRHPQTGRLADLAKNDLPQILKTLQRVEVESLRGLQRSGADLTALALEIKNTIDTGGRIFFCGCGATGRLSLSLETLWREEVTQLEKPRLADKVFSFMAGGDYALIRSIEKFEDHFDYGARQLHDAGFKENDLLIASTEGGETPFVIGATEEALKISKRAPFFHFCNPKEILVKTTERSRRVIENPRVISTAFETGPMALAGSTRLQASTVLMLAGGCGLFQYLDAVPGATRVDQFIKILESTDFACLAPLIDKEADLYANGNFCLHQTNDYGMTVVTDTTERTPTFSLKPFEVATDPTSDPSWTYLCVPNAKTSVEAWRRILGREPRALKWDGFTEKYGHGSVLSFDFSEQTIKRRKRLAPQLSIYDIQREEGRISLSLEGYHAALPRPTDLLLEHLLLKCAMNFSSTLVMGRLGRFESNLMLYVRATNNKLIDRAIRYVQALLKDDGFGDVDYALVCEELFRLMPVLEVDQPIVIHTYEALRPKLRRIIS